MSASEFVNIIRNEAMKAYGSEYRGFELGTVVSSQPHLGVRIDNMKLVLGPEDLMVCERLTRHNRVVSLKSTPGTVRQLGDEKKTDCSSFSKNTGTSAATIAAIVMSGQSHVLESFEIKDASAVYNYVELCFEDVLKAGDRVLVQALPGGQKYVIIDRMVGA